jgi:hypothetical protein
MANFTVVQDDDDTITITSRVAGELEITIDDNLANITVTATNVTDPAQPDNLRAVLEVFTDTGDPNTDASLLKQHSPYEFATASTSINISPAFAHLEPYLPPANSINPASVPALLYGVAASVFQKYYLRYADKYGAPAFSEAMVKSASSYLAVLGSRAGDAVTTDAGGLLHSYRRTDGVVFRKPVSDTQPDWVYWLCPSDISEVFVTVLIYWSDGTTSEYEPWGSSLVTVEPGEAYYFISGYRQLKLHNQAPSGSTAADAYIVGYDWRLGPTDDSLNYRAIVRYDVAWYWHWHHYLLFSNGLGGCESVSLRGKSKQGYIIDAETVRRTRKARSSRDTTGHTVTDGDVNLLYAEGQKTFEMNTGWFDDPYYLEHLQQLPLAHAWLIDLTNRRFLRVIVDTSSLDAVRADDETLFSLKFTLKAGWIDQSFNI